MKRKINFRKVFFILFSFIILGFLISTILSNDSNNEYVFTKAICNESNYCKDYEITCNRGSITGMVALEEIQFSKNWTDPRSDDLIEKEC